MDASTLDYYALHAAEVVARYDAIESPVSRYFNTAFAQGGRLLDIGCGSGRDLAALLAQGFDAYGVEPVEALRQHAEARYPQLAGRITAGGLPALGTTSGGAFDGILCSAVLMHVPEAELFDSALAIKAALRPDARLLLSLPGARSGLNEAGRDNDGRLFSVTQPAQLLLLFERLGFQLLDRFSDPDRLGRHELQWTTYLLVLRDAAAMRPVDRIESILNRDRKVATYKLALCRALAELAMQEPRIASWRPDQRVAIPVRRIAEKWLQYYWPLFAAARTLPQIQGQATTGGNSLAFQASMQQLMHDYAGQGAHGGFAAWALDLDADRLPPDRQQLLRRTLRSIEQAIRQGPVHHTGRQSEGGPVFAYDATSRSVLMDESLWREFTLLGHWIQDAVILRWAALSARLGGEALGLDAGVVLTYLLATPDPVRSTAIARDVFLAAPDLRCVWTDRPVAPGRLAVDHVIPFFLWGSNDLWNLLPTLDSVNARKSDLLPSSDLLIKRRDAIIQQWECLQSRMPDAFHRQATHLLGPAPVVSGNWQSLLFARLREMTEITAQQRGIRRWNG